MSNFNEELRKNVNREGDQVFEELGYRVAFFSSKKVGGTSGISVSVGNRDKEFVNTCVMNLPYLVNFRNEEEADRLVQVFCELAEIFRPFWGAIVNNAWEWGPDQYYKKTTPTSLHWVNYFSDFTAERIGVNKIEKIAKQYPEISWNNKILKISKLPIESVDRAGIAYVKKLNRMLSLRWRLR